MYVENTCVVTSDFPHSFDSSVEGNVCNVDYSNVTTAPFLPTTARNTYHTASGAFNLGCSAPYYTLASLQALGLEEGSSVVKGYAASDIVAQARALLV